VLLVLHYFFNFFNLILFSLCFVLDQVRHFDVHSLDLSERDFELFSVLSRLVNSFHLSEDLQELQILTSSPHLGQVFVLHLELNAALESLA